MTDTIKHNGKEYTVTVEHDDDAGPPWIDCDGHGDVSDWTTRAKLPGELILSENGSRKRYYDFASACNMARDESWGFLPGKVVVDRFAHSGKRKFRAWIVNGTAEQVAYGNDVNAARKALYVKYRATMTARQYAAGAAMSDFKHLKAWCDDEWSYWIVTVRHKGDCECCGESESLCGVGCEYGDGYIMEVARELAEQLED